MGAEVARKPSIDALPVADELPDIAGLQKGAQITFSAVVGYCSGYAVKKVGKVAVVGIGITFIGLQVRCSLPSRIMCAVSRRYARWDVTQALRYFGYIDGVNWGKVRDHVVTAVDTDGSGTITRKDVVTHWNRFMDVCSYNVPGRVAFAAMALLGFKHG